MEAVVKSSLRTGKAPVAVFFNDIRPGRSESQLRFRLIHFWEAKNIAKGGAFLGLELLLIDQQGTVMRGFISPTRAQTYRRHLIAGALYALQNFFATKSKEIYRVADPSLTISFSNNSVLSPLDVDNDYGTGSFPADRFRFHSHGDFEANVGLRGDLYDVVGHLRLVNGQALMTRPLLDEADIASMGHILVHLQTKDEPVMKLYLWDAAAREFFKKFTASVDTPTVLMVTTVNPKNLGGNLALSSMSSSRVFLDKEIQPTTDYFSWFSANPDLAERVNADEVTKIETMTIGQIFGYIKREDAKEASFYCVATIDDVVCDRAWYYIACSGCQTKATKGPSSLMCAKCGKSNVSGVAKYLAKISVYDNNDHAQFVLLGNAGTELTGKPAAELVDSYFEANQDVGAGHYMPAPQVLIETVGQTYKFKLKVSDLNLTGKIQALTVTKIVSADAMPPLPNSSEFIVIVEDEAPLPSAAVSDASVSNALDGTGGTSDKDEAQVVKRPKHD
ncbi:hypothetical protein N665_0148s0006 [Sinapis alba]|nr:hypothetical protein N665_0148s0006 [Sinapis alba]